MDGWYLKSKLLDPPPKKNMKETWFGLVCMFLLHVLNGQVGGGGGGESNKIQMILRWPLRFELNFLAIQICLSSFQINPSNNRKELIVDFHVKKEFQKNIDPLNFPDGGENTNRKNEQKKRWNSENGFWIMWWLVVSTHLKNISKNGNLPQVGMNIKNIWNHHLDVVVSPNGTFGGLDWWLGILGGTHK